MRICHITAHVPPDQAANALLPFNLGLWASEAGDEVCYVAHVPRAGEAAALPGPVRWAPSNRGRGWLARVTRIGSLMTARAMIPALGPMIVRADVVHVHGNGLLPEMGVWLARRARKPVLLTLYGTEIWHYRARSFGLDLFTRAYRRAALVTFYSQRLLDRALELGLRRDGLEVVYPAVASHFVRHDAASRARLRQTLGLSATHVLVNVKRLHPLAGQRYLLEAMKDVLRTHPDTRLIICGTGPLRQELEQLAVRLGVASHVTFTGLLDNARVAEYCAAADAFVLPSLLEALPTVAVEALASGTRVVSADHPGGLELRALFGDDVNVVPREDAPALAAAIRQTLDEQRRTSAGAEDVIKRRFDPVAVWARYREMYLRAIETER